MAEIRELLRNTQRRDGKQRKINKGKELSIIIEHTERDAKQRKLIDKELRIITEHTAKRYNIKKNE